MFEHKRFGFARAVMNALKLMGKEAELDFIAYVRDATKDVTREQTIYDHECRVIPPAATPMPRVELVDTSDAGRPPVTARGVLREQSELIAKYAAELDKAMDTHECRRKCATCIELRSRATLARDMSLIYFRAATLEV